MAELAPCRIYSQIATVGAGMSKTHSLLSHHHTAGWHLAGTEAHMHMSCGVGLGADLVTSLLSLLRGTV